MNDKFSEKPPFYITSAISYPNGEPHIGHAYELVGADTIARFKRLDGYEVRFVTGTDEHGVKMAKTAEAKGVSVRELADTNSARFRALGGELNLSIDEFVRTTEPRHAKSVQELWRRMADNGDIYEGAYAGWYSMRDEAYYDESELTEGTEGQKLSPQGTEVEWVEEPSFFFRLSDFEDRLLNYYRDNPDFIAPPERLNEVVSFVKSGLNDLSISRTTFDWGVPVPDVTGHVMYVWVDALSTYITGLGYPDDEAGNFAKFWPADLHVIGKDILRFHTVYWPAFLMSAGLPLPKRVFGHGFLTVDGKKMSKSLGNVIDPLELTEEFGADAVRYYFLREVSFGHDGDYGRAKFINRINADLANDLGNLAQRSLSMVAKHCGGLVPEPGAFTDADREILAAADALLGPARQAVDKQALHKMLALVWQVVAEANRYFAGEEPWALRKTDMARMDTVLYVTAEVIRQVAILAQPVVPTSAAKLLDLLNIDEGKRDFSTLGEAGRLTPGTELPVPQGVFPRFVEKDTERAAS